MNQALLKIYQKFPTKDSLKNYQKVIKSSLRDATNYFGFIKGNPPETDEELMDRLMTYKNGYYLSKKSAYIKMAIQLNIKNVKKRESDDFIKNMLADRCIVTISNNK